MAEHETEYETIRYEVRDRVARLELHRPEVRNAMSPTMIREILDALGRAKDDPGVGVVVLTGAGDKVFCAGGDLGGIGEGQAEGKGPAEEGGPRVLFETFAGLGKPIIGRLNGHAMAGGLGLACACDIVIAPDDVKLGTPEINVGLWPMVIMATISRNVGPKQALKLYMTGEPVTAEEAVRIGLVTEAVPRAELDARVDALAASLAEKSPIVMKLGRDAYYGHRDLPFAEQLDFLAGELNRVAATEDSQEGVRAFTEKRKPVYTGR
ncbi:MAG: enoyl-CoA hydratase-related protein [Acidimicrobiia bacterium]|nr:enoyl-CoA hydratase-related protein [Acidimicrobiia bacterium]